LMSRVESRRQSLKLEVILLKVSWRARALISLKLKSRFLSASNV
jgi:hypothetical protein